MLPWNGPDRKGRNLLVFTLNELFISDHPITPISPFFVCVAGQIRIHRDDSILFLDCVHKPPLVLGGSNLCTLGWSAASIRKMQDDQKKQTQLIFNQTYHTVNPPVDLPAGVLALITQPKKATDLLAGDRFTLELDKSLQLPRPESDAHNR